VTSFNRDSRGAGNALRTSRPGPQRQPSENPASSAAGGSGQQQESRSNPVGSAAGGSGTQRQWKYPSPSSTGGNIGEDVSLRAIRKEKETNEKRGSIVKTGYLFSFILSLSSLSWLYSFCGRQELCTELEREFNEFTCPIHDDTAGVKSLKFSPA
jgi:hypothetical protein